MNVKPGLTRFLSWSVPVLATSWLVRWLFVTILPSYAYSWDISSWQRVAEILGSGRNPYSSTTFLNWPPLWMVCIYAMSRISEVTGVAFITVLRVLLVAVESGLIILTGTLIERLAPGADVRRILLFGMALNPIAVFVVCQHGNFDVIATTFVMASLLALVVHNQTANETDWLLACSMLGLAVLTKTYPIALTPLLMPGARSARWRARLMGGCALLGPAAFSMSILYVLEPEAIIRNVLRYRSRPGAFGLSGLAKSLDLPLLFQASQMVGTVLIVLIVIGAILAWKHQQPTPKRMVMIAALILLAIPTLGPGFGMQYAAWFIAPIVVTFACGSRSWKRTVMTSYIVSAATYFVLYGYASDLGQFMTFLSGRDGEIAFARFVKSFSGQFQVSLPMFVCWMATLTVGVLDLVNRAEGDSPAETTAISGNSENTKQAG